MRCGVRAYIGAARSCGNWQESTAFERVRTPLSRSCRDDADAARGAGGGVRGRWPHWANPSSPHAEGRAARAALEEARATIAEALGWRHDVIFTSGASEAIEIAAKRVRVPGRAHGAAEHAIVPCAMGRGSKVMPVDA